jgi:hypothetical protein
MAFDTAEVTVAFARDMRRHSPVRWISLAT